MKNVLIVGYGIVGHNLHKELIKLNPDIYDKFKTEYNTKRDIKYDFCFICVDTPYIDDNNVCDISQVEEALQENDADIYIIKSTILPNTTNDLSSMFNKNIIFSPEYYGNTQHCNNFDFNFTILGGERELCYKVQQLLQEVYDGRHIFEIVDSRVAEVAKYFENTELAFRVLLCCEFKSICDMIGIHYEDVRKCRNLDPRMNPSHSFVYDDHDYYDSHCLNKDTKAIAKYTKSKLLNDLINANEERKRKSKKN